MNTMNNAMLYVRHAELLRDKVPSFRTYPFHLPAVRDLHRLEFQKQVTFLVGENGTGKSTLLEGIAAAWGFNPEGGTLNFSFNTRSSHSHLYEFFRIAKGVRRPKDGFFLRAESYYNVATYIDELDEEPKAGNFIKDSYGGKSLHEQSHGESFFPPLFTVLAAKASTFSTSRRLPCPRCGRCRCWCGCMSWCSSIRSSLSPHIHLS